MTTLKKRPYELFLFTAIALVIAFVFPVLAFMDFKHLSMFSLPVTTIVWIIPLLLVGFWVLYLLTNKFLYSKIITRIHVISTVVLTLLLMIAFYLGVYAVPTETATQEAMGNTVQLLFLLVVGVQFAYLVNIVFGILKNHKQSEHTRSDH